MVKPSRRKEMAQQTAAIQRTSIRVCVAFGISESCYRYQPKLDSETAEISNWLIKLADKESDWGSDMCFEYLRSAQGFHWNHQRAYRIYCALSLHLRIRPRRWLNRPKPEPLTQPLRQNRVWTMGCMHDQLSDGHNYRLYNVIIDESQREGLAIEVGFSLLAIRVVRTLTLNGIIEPSGKAGLANIFSRHWKQYRIIQHSGSGFTIMNDRTKLMAASRR